MSETVVKWRRISSDRQARISHRLARIARNPPPGVAPLLSFGWTGGDLLRLEFERLNAVSLHDHRKNLNRGELRSIAQRLFALLVRWEQLGFVHGDLSPRNILIGKPEGQSREFNDACPWIIDFLMDLNTFEGTPAYASPEVFKGRHSAESDRFAATQILRSFE